MIKRINLIYNSTLGITWTIGQTQQNYGKDEYKMKKRKCQTRKLCSQIPAELINIKRFESQPHSVNVDP